MTHHNISKMFLKIKERNLYMFTELSFMYKQALMQNLCILKGKEWGKTKYSRFAIYCYAFDIHHKFIT